MTKAAPLSLGLILLLAATAPMSAQTSPEDMAVNQAVLRQANTIILRQKLLDAKNTAGRGDLPGAAKLYEDAYALVEQIGSGINATKRRWPFPAWLPPGLRSPVRHKVRVICTKPPRRSTAC